MADHPHGVFEVYPAGEEVTDGGYWGEESRHVSDPALLIAFIDAAIALAHEVSQVAAEEFLGQVQRGLYVHWSTRHENNG